MSTTNLKKELILNKKITFRLKVKAGAKQNAWLEPLADGTYRLAIKAVPEAGKANAAIIKFVAETLAIAPDQVRIISGASTSLKKIAISI